MLSGSTNISFSIVLLGSGQHDHGSVRICLLFGNVVRKNTSKFSFFPMASLPFDNTLDETYSYERKNGT